MESKTGKKRGPKVVEPSIIRFERISELLEREKLTKKEFAERLGREPNNVTRILKSMKISEDFINSIINAFPDYQKEWLLGYGRIPTYTEAEKARELQDVLDAPITMLESSLRVVCTRENLPVPTLSDPGELMLLVAQLQDYSDSLMWNYVKWKKSSHVWSFLDQVEEAIKRRDKANG